MPNGLRKNLYRMHSLIHWGKNFHLNKIIRLVSLNLPISIL
jgi:hypothetical protein